MSKHTRLEIAALIILLLGLFAVGVAEMTSPIGLTPVSPVESVLFKAQEVTVRIAVLDNGQYGHTGSGFVAHSGGFIVTARHVVARPASYRVVWGDGLYLDAKVVFVSTFTDCAVLKVSLEGLACAQMRESGPNLGERVYVVGTPVDALFEGYAAHGIVSKARVDLEDSKLFGLFMVDAAINPGNSGGPVFDADGRVLGIVIARVPGAYGMGFVVSSCDIEDVLTKARNEWEQKAKAAKS